MNDGIATGLAALAMTRILSISHGRRDCHAPDGARNDAYFEASPMEDVIAMACGLAITQLFLGIGKSTGLPEGELPRRGKRGHPGVRACGPRNDAVLFNLWR